MSRTLLRPYLIAKDAAGVVHITVRSTRLNSQGYPLVSSSVLEESFPTLNAARAHAKKAFGAEASDIATK